MATLSWRSLGSAVADTSLVPDVTIARGDGLTTPATSTSIVIRSTFTQEITGFGGGIVFFVDSKDADGSTETPTPAGQLRLMSSRLIFHRVHAAHLSM